MTKKRDSKRFILTLSASALLLGGCGGGMGGCNGGGDQVQQGANWTSLQTEADKETVDQEGPQYQQPSMDNLKGKPQLFPAKYAVKRYPNSRVVMAYVRPDLLPGQKNVVLLNSSDQQQVISEYYLQNMVKDGWKVTYRAENSAFSQITYQKGNQEAEVRIMADPQGRKHVQLLSGPFKAIAKYQTELPKSAVREN